MLEVHAILQRQRCNENITKKTGTLSDAYTENGFFTVVIPADVAERVKKIASIKKLYAVRQLNVITKPGGIPKRVLITFSFSNQECIVEELLTELARHQYSEEYMTLTRDYYLNM